MSVSVTSGKHLTRVPPAMVTVSNTGERGLIPAQPFWPPLNSIPTSTNTQAASPPSPGSQHPQAHLNRVTSGVGIQHHGNLKPPRGKPSRPVFPRLVLAALSKILNAKQETSTGHKGEVDVTQQLADNQPPSTVTQVLRDNTTSTSRPKHPASTSDHLKRPSTDLEPPVHPFQAIAPPREDSNRLRNISTHHSTASTPTGTEERRPIPAPKPSPSVNKGVNATSAVQQSTDDYYYYYHDEDDYYYYDDLSDSVEQGESSEQSSGLPHNTTTTITETPTPTGTEKPPITLPPSFFGSPDDAHQHPPDHTTTATPPTPEDTPSKTPKPRPHFPLPPPLRPVLPGIDLGTIIGKGRHLTIRAPAEDLLAYYGLIHALSSGEQTGRDGGGPVYFPTRHDSYRTSAATTNTDANQQGDLLFIDA